MPLTEFKLIDRYFRNVGPTLDETVCAVGDDCAVLRPPEDQLLLVTTDTLVEEVHFLAGTDPESLGHKSLAVNLSDLAAMGATPKWITLSLTLPEVNEAWLEAFARGFRGLAERYGVQLVGGDTTRGPLSITVQAIGTAPAERVLYRCGARPGDLIYLTGTIGDAGLALKKLNDRDADCPGALRERLERPEPRVEAGQMIGGLASACIDISDGFAADLEHLLEAGRVGARVNWNQIPLSDAVHRYVTANNDFSLPLCAGDDYELCFTVPVDREKELIRRVAALPYPCHRVGTIDHKPGIRIENLDRTSDLRLKGYEHFS